MGGLCGIYEASPDAHTRDGVPCVRCSVCQSDFTHSTPAGAEALFASHVDSGSIGLSAGDGEQG